MTHNRRRQFRTVMQGSFGELVVEMINNRGEQENGHPDLVGCLARSEANSGERLHPARKP